MTKKCTKCQEDKSLEDDFYNDKRTSDGKYPYCKKCWGLYSRKRRKEDPKTKTSTRESNKKWRRKDREKRRSVYRDRGRAQHLKKKYGLSLLEYEELLKRQEGRCAICREVPTGIGTDTLCVDHDHRQNCVRGLLCHQCNQGLGKFQDRPDLLMRAAFYLDP